MSQQKQNVQETSSNVRISNRAQSQRQRKLEEQVERARRIADAQMTRLPQRKQKTDWAEEMEDVLPVDAMDDADEGWTYVAQKRFSAKEWAEVKREVWRMKEQREWEREQLRDYEEQMWFDYRTERMRVRKDILEQQDRRARLEREASRLDRLEANGGLVSFEPNSRAIDVSGSTSIRSGTEIVKVLCAPVHGMIPIIMIEDKPSANGIQNYRIAIDPVHLIKTDDSHLLELTTRNKWIFKQGRWIEQMPLGGNKCFVPVHQDGTVRAWRFNDALLVRDCQKKRVVLKISPIKGTSMLGLDANECCHNLQDSKGKNDPIHPSTCFFLTKQQSHGIVVVPHSNFETMQKNMLIHEPLPSPQTRNYRRRLFGSN